MIKVVIFDNDPEVRYGIYNYFKQSYEVYVTKDENEVFEILNQTNVKLIIFDCSIISIGLSKFIDKLREHHNKILVMILSPALNANDRTEVFNSNIDDYMNKPIDMLELQFRIENLLRKQSSQYRRFITTNNLVINRETNSLSYHNEKIEFSNKEFQILYHLFSYPNKIFSKN